MTDAGLARTASLASALSASAPPFSGLAPYWLPEEPDFIGRIRALESAADPASAWDELIALAQTRLDFVQTSRLDRTLQRLISEGATPRLATRPIKLAVLGSSTLGHLLPAIRVGGLRRGILIRTYEGEFGQYRQALLDPGCDLHDFRPDAVLFAFDAAHLMRGVSADLTADHAAAALAEILAELRECWNCAREAFHCHILQQTALPIFPALLGSNEHRLPGSRRRLTALLNAALRTEADEARVDLVAVDDRAAQDGISQWHDPVLWHRAKQEVSPAAAPLYGELVARLIAARQGRSRKCLVLDLDNTLWGGVIGDEGIDGVVLGHGSALGEAFLSVQRYAREQARRGVIIAVCSKNEEATALAAFDRHPEMILRRGDIACFAVNWNDKVANLRSIARQLEIGLDSLVLLDDSPFERGLVRSELPMVAVPEIPADPALFAACLADAGYFEGLAVTGEDRARGGQYQANLARHALASEAADLPSYLRGLEMRLIVRPFDRPGLQRIVQLINKTNQFNLTTRRYTEDEVMAVMADPRAFGLQFRLLDRFGDNGVIGIVIVRLPSADEALIDTWLMSCRVLGRGVEQAMLGVVAATTRRRGARRLIGEYRPTAKNSMVRDLFERLGFEPMQRSEEKEEEEDGVRIDCLWLQDYVQPENFIKIEEGRSA